MPAVDAIYKKKAVVPEFVTAKEFVEAKIEMLEVDFRIKLSDEDKLHLKTLKTEGDINAAVRSLIAKYWGD